MWPPRTSTRARDVQVALQAAREDEHGVHDVAELGRLHEPRLCSAREHKRYPYSCTGRTRSTSTVEQAARALVQRKACLAARPVHIARQPLIVRVHRRPQAAPHERRTYSFFVLLVLIRVLYTTMYEYVYLLKRVMKLAPSFFTCTALLYY